MLLASIMIFSVTAAVSAKEPFAKLDVPKCETAPVIDGVISDGEYKLVATYDATSSDWSRDTHGLENYSPELQVFATWDDNYFYLAVRAKNLDPNYTNGPDLYCFQQPSLMTAMVYDDPTLPVFASSDGSDWDWLDAYNASFSREWTIGRDKAGDLFEDSDIEYSGTNHFGALKDHADYKFEVKHGEYDVYEQAIPWAAIAKTDGIEVGGSCGLAFSACVISSVDEDYTGGYICYASGIDGAKNFERYAKVTLTANEPFDKVEESDPDPSEDSDPDPTPPTGDYAIAFVVLSIIALAGAAVVTAKKSR